MKHKNSHISPTLWSIPVLILYGLFFIVQVFFNFEAPFAGTGSHKLFLSEKRSQHTRTTVAHNHTNKGQHSTIRLNKRFQPASCPVLYPLCVEAPVSFIKEPGRTIYRAPYHSLYRPFTPALRGPPAVVYPFV